MCSNALISQLLFLKDCWNNTTFSFSLKLKKTFKENYCKTSMKIYNFVIIIIFIDLPNCRRRPRTRGQAGRQVLEGSWLRCRRRSCPEVDRRIAASGTASEADSSTATGTRSPARRAGGVPVADASRHDRDVLSLTPWGRVLDVAQLDGCLAYPPTYLRERGRENCVRECVCRALEPYALPHADL